MYRFAVIVLAFFTFSYSQVVSAQAAASAVAYELFMAKVTSFGASTVSFASNGAVLAASGSPVFSAPTFTAGGGAVATSARVAVGSGTAAVSVVGSASGASVFSAFRAVTGGPLGLALLASPIIIDWLSQGGVRPAPNGAAHGQPFEYRIPNGTCTVQLGNGTSHTASSCAAAVRAGLSQAGQSNPINCPGVKPGDLCGFYGDSYWNSEVLYPVTIQSVSSGVSPYLPASMDDIAPYMDKPTPPEVFKELLKAGAKIEVVPRFINGPEYVPLPKEVTVTETPEKITTTEKEKGVKLEYKTKTDPDTGRPTPYVQATPKEITTVKEKDKATGQEKVISVTETEGGEKPKNEPQDIETCGLPGKPACIIDETGMPDQAAIDAKMDEKKAKNVYKDIEDMAKDPTSKLPEHPIINWSFSLPTGCAVIPLPAFEPFISPIDVCQFKPMFHDVMNIVWLFGGIFGAISLFMKNALSN